MEKMGLENTRYFKEFCDSCHRVTWHLTDKAFGGEMCFDPDHKERSAMLATAIIYLLNQGKIYRLFMVVTATAFWTLFLILVFTHKAHADEIGQASWYDSKSSFNDIMASGRNIDLMEQKGVPYAAMYDVKFGTEAKVTNLANGKSTKVYILDRGPNKRFRPKRVIDLNKRSFKRISSLKKGVIKVKVEIIKKRVRHKSTRRYVK